MIRGAKFTRPARKCAPACTSALRAGCSITPDRELDMDSIRHALPLYGLDAALLSDVLPVPQVTRTGGIILNGCRPEVLIFKNHFYQLANRSVSAGES